MLAVLWIAMPLGAGNALGMSGLIIAAAVAMDAIRGWQQTREALEVETEHAEREQARRAVLEERARIGRELHDVVAHHMSLIAVQAETAPYRVGEIPESVSGEFTAISAAARTALAEMRRLLGVLRNDEEAARAPQPQIDADRRHDRHRPQRRHRRSSTRRPTPSTPSRRASGCAPTGSCRRR